MNRNIKLSENVYYLGVNDRRTSRFENLWPLPQGVSYNAYLINDKKTVLVDTVEFTNTESLLLEIQDILQGKPLDYLIVNHAEPDHSGAFRGILKMFPDVCVVGNSNTFKFLDGFYGESQNKLVVAHGDILNTGDRELTFYSTPMVHWPETMMTFDNKDGILFSGDAFGSFKSLDGGVFDDELDINLFEDEMRRYYSNIVGKYGKNVQRAFKTLEGVPIKMIASTHGPVYRKDPSWVLERYDKWSREETRPGAVVIYGSMYGHTEEMADYFARKLKEYGVPEIEVYDASETHPSFMISAVWKYNGVVLASPAYNNGLFPSVKQIVHKFLERKMASRHVAILGTSTWSGGGVKALNKHVEELGWDKVGDSIEAKYSAKPNDYELCDALAKELAEAILS